MSQVSCLKSHVFSYLRNPLVPKIPARFMQSIPSIVKGLKAKTEKVLALHETLHRDNMQLKERVIKLKNRVEELENANRLLEHNYKTLQIAKSISGDDNKNLALKLKINELVREIDKCIAQLNR
jgi:hypothetical protein